MGWGGGGANPRRYRAKPACIIAFPFLSQFKCRVVIQAAIAQQRFFEDVITLGESPDGAVLTTAYLDECLLKAAGMLETLFEAVKVAKTYIRLG